MVQSSQETYVRNGFWPKLAEAAAQLPFAEELLAAWYCATDAATPLRVKVTLFAALAYFILPFDAIPDVIVGLGFTDDMAVVMAAVALVRNNITADHRNRARESLQELKRKPEPSGSQ
jgi:uncharacterized membrane protein YkvA (DUF1232 family)